MSRPRKAGDKENMTSKPASDKALESAQPKAGIPAQSDDKELTLPELNEKKRKFIELLLLTGKTFDAYREAGFTGNYQAAYQMRHRLMPWIKQLANANPSDVYRTLHQLEQVPLEKKPATFQEKLALARFQARLAKIDGGESQGQPPHKQYSTLVIQRFDQAAGL